MIDLRSVFIANCLGIAILLLLIYSSRTKILRQREEDRVYIFMIAGVLAGCILEIAGYVVDGRSFPGNSAVNTAINTCLYAINPMLTFCVIVFVDLGLYEKTSRIWEKYKLQIFILIGLGILCAVNIFVPVIFRVSEENVYERLPLSYIFYAVMLFYCFTAMYTVHRYEKDNGAKAFFNIHVFLVPILVGAGLQFMFYGLSLAWLAASIGLIGLFMMQQNETAYIDSLVDTYNRQYLDYISGAWIARGIPFYGVMLDIDRFKRINDTFGHSEGDRVLKNVADILKEARGQDEWVFRFAGDEFIVLRRSSFRDGLDLYIDRVKAGVEKFNQSGRPYRLRLSYGAAQFDGKNLDAFLREMDEKMYVMKAEHHRREAETADAQA